MAEGFSDDVASLQTASKRPAAFRCLPSVPLGEPEVTRKTGRLAEIGNELRECFRPMLRDGVLSWPGFHGQTFRGKDFLAPCGNRGKIVRRKLLNLRALDGCRKQPFLPHAGHFNRPPQTSAADPGFLFECSPRHALCAPA